MRRVDFAEFVKDPRRYLLSGENFAVVVEGSEIGRFIASTSTRSDQAADAIAQLDEAVRSVLEKTGMSEDQLADLFDLSKPFPETRDAENIAQTQVTYATRH